MREMKDSGTLWLRSIPTSWTLSRIGSLYSVRNEKVSDKDFAPLSVTMRGIVPQLATAAKSDDGDNRKLVRKGDFAINSRSDRRGSCGISDYTGSVSLINTVLTPRKNMHPGYYNWLFHTTEFADEFYRYGHGIVDDLWTTRWQEMKSILVPVPDINEQSRIAAYLDRRCATIDALIANQQQQIDKLKQYKQAVITEAVTRGLDPNVRLKDSGNRRIGMIPHHWQLNRTKTFIQNVSSGLSAITSNESGELCGKYVLRTSSVSSGFLKIEERKPVLWNAEDRLICPVERNTIIMSRMNTASMVGYCAYVDKDYLDTYLPDKLWKIKLRSGMHPKYLWYLVNAPVSHCYFASLATGTSASMLNISMEDFQALEIAVPPSDEQKAIIHYLDTKCAQIDALIALKQQKADKLAQYKKSLIYEVVTGKREV